eukprot:5707711-Alexandrium_andersonii.AAC.1
MMGVSMPEKSVATFTSQCREFDRRTLAGDSRGAATAPTGESQTSGANSPTGSMDAAGRFRDEAGFRRAGACCLDLGRANTKASSTPRRSMTDGASLQPKWLRLSLGWYLWPGVAIILALKQCVIV